MNWDGGGHRGGGGVKAFLAFRLLEFPATKSY